MNYQVHIKHTDISNTGGHVVQLISLRKWQRKSSVAKYVNSNFFINTLNQIQFLVESTFTLLHWLKFILFIIQRVSLLKRLHLIYAFFFVRKIIAHWVTFFFYCIVIPACVVVPEVNLTKKIAIYIPATITILNALSTPR
jgi:hypothetical protein